MRPDDRIRLRHMLDAAVEALSFTRERCREDLDADRQLVLAPLKLLEMVGEVSTKVSDETRSLVGLPWTDIAGMRHRLIHAYYDIDLDRVWDTIIADLPPLVRELESLDLELDQPDR